MLIFDLRTVRIDDSRQVIWPAHTASPHSMVDSIGASPNNIQDLVIGCHIDARVCLMSNKNRLHGVGFENGASTVESSNSDFLISGVRKPVRADNRMRARIVGSDRDIPTREGRNSRDTHRCVVLEIGGSLVQRFGLGLTSLNWRPHRLGAFRKLGGKRVVLALASSNWAFREALTSLEGCLLT